MKKLKILGVHGLGDHRGTTWKEDWTAALRQAVPGQQSVDLDVEFVTYDDIFANVDLTAWESMQAVWKLARSGLSTALGKSRGVLGDVSDRVKWTAGYVVAWVENEKFQRESRKRVLDAIVDVQPDVVCAHSLGSLVTYNAFAHPDAAAAKPAAALRRTRYVTLGSQLANAFVVGNLAGGRLGALPVSYWHHLFNDNDAVFTAPIKLWDMENFAQVDTPFDIDGFADHSAVAYLTHPSTIENVWRPIAERRISARSFGMTLRRERPATVAREGRLRRRALLVGINQYPREEDRLDGCVNDAFLRARCCKSAGSSRRASASASTSVPPRKASPSGSSGCWTIRVRATSASFSTAATARRFRSTVRTSNPTGRPRRSCRGTSTGRPSARSSTIRSSASTASSHTRLASR
jgi:hypothetical protein